MAKSNNKTNYEILSQKELKDKKIYFFVKYLEFLLLK